MASRESGLLFSLERGLRIAVWVRQEKKALTSRGWGLLRGFLELRRPWGFSHEARRGSQGASRAVPGKSGLCARGEGERVMALQSWERTRASRRVEEGHSRSFSGGGGKPWVPSTCASDLRKLLSVPLRSQGHCGVGRGLSELHWVWCNGRGPHDKLRQEPQGSSPGFECAGSDSDRRVPAELGQEIHAHFKRM